MVRKLRFQFYVFHFFMFSFFTPSAADSLNKFIYTLLRFFSSLFFIWGASHLFEDDFRSYSATPNCRPLERAKYRPQLHLSKPNHQLLGFSS